MNREYKATYDYLFDKEEELFYRDHRYFKQKEANGKKVFWGRGNGWVLGGLCEILQTLPRNNMHRQFYQDLFITLSNRIVRLQGKDGYWHASLLDNVIVYSNATILGRITIGQGATVGGNIWVTEDVPAGARIVQTKAKK